MAPAGYDQVIRVWSTAEHSYMYELNGHTNAILSLFFHPNEPILLSCSIDESIKVWDIGDGRCLRQKE